MNDVTYEFLNEFITYKLSNGCNRGGVNSYLASIRPVYKEAQRRKSLNVKQDNPFIGLFKKAQKKEVVNIDTNELKAFLGYERTIKHNDKTWELTKRNIELFKFQFDIGGHDLVDVALLTWKKYKKGRLVFKRHKNRNKDNGGELVSVKVFDNAFIKNYGNKDTERIFSFIPDPVANPKEYKNFQSNLNRSLKAISKNLKIDRISSKSPRYIFRSLAGEMQLSDLMIMQIQGHKKTGMTFNYQKRIPDKVVDEVHLKVISCCNILQKN